VTVLKEKLVAPSLLACDFTRIKEQTDTLAAAGCKILHLDVMDGVFVKNISFGQPVVASVRKASPLILDTHLMITDPIRYVDSFSAAGADIITVHLESAPDIAPALKRIRALGKKAGLSIKPATDPEKLMSLLPLCDLILIMTVEPGFGGQKLIPETLRSIRAVRKAVDDSKSEIYVEADGGIGADNIAYVSDVGADIAVAGSAVFGKQNIAGALRNLTTLMNT